MNLYSLWTHRPIAYLYFMQASAMLKVSTLVCFAVWSGSSRAQPLLEQTDQRHDIVYSFGIERAPSGNWLVKGSHNFENATSWSTFCRVLSPTGELIGEFPFGNDLEAHPNGVIYTVKTQYCDVGVPGTFLLASTENGNLVGSILIHAADSDFFNFSAMKIARRSSNKLALIANNKTMVTTLSGDILNYWDTPFGNANVDRVTGSFWTRSDSLVMWNSSSLAVVDATTGTRTNYSVGEAVKDVIYRNDSILALTTHGIRILNAALDPLGTVEMISTDTLIQFLPNDQALWIRSTTGAVELNGSLIAVNTIPIEPFPGQITTGGLLLDDRIVISSQIPYHGRRTAVLKEYFFDGSTANHDVDVRLEVEVDSTFHNPNFNPFQAHITLRLTNFGNATIDSVLVNYQLGQNFICGIDGTSVLYTDLDLAPGETTTRTIPSLHIGPWYIPPGIFTYEVCMIALSPNGLVDRNMDDNYSCVSVQLGEDVITGIGSIGVPGISVAPNPTTGRTTIHGLAAATGTLEVRDMVGRAVERILNASTNEGSLSIDLSSLPTGRYTVSFKSEAGAMIFPVVKVD